MLIFCETPILQVAASSSDQPPINHLPQEMLGTTPALGASNMSHVANFGLYSMRSIMEFVSQHASSGHSFDTYWNHFGNVRMHDAWHQ